MYNNVVDYALVYGQTPLIRFVEDLRFLVHISCRTCCGFAVRFVLIFSMFHDKWKKVEFVHLHKSITSKCTCPCFAEQYSMSITTSIIITATTAAYFRHRVYLVFASPAGITRFVAHTNHPFIYIQDKPKTGSLCFIRLVTLEVFSTSALNLAQVDVISFLKLSRNSSQTDLETNIFEK